MKRERPSPTCCPKITSDKKVIGSHHGSRDQISESSCCTEPKEVGEYGRNDSPPRITPEIIGSVEAQLELLRHELFLAKKQVKERNGQILKLERIINHQTLELKHNCEGSSNLIKTMDLLYDAVDVQNQQLENIRNIKERLASLEASPLCFHKSVKSEKIKKNCDFSQSVHLPDASGDLLMRNHCRCMCSCNCQHEMKTTQNRKIRPRPTDLSSDPRTTKEHKSTMTENNSEASCRMDLNHCNKTLEELEKQRMINCHLNEHILKLQDEVKTLKAKIETYEENSIAASKSASLIIKEKQDLLNQLSTLTKQNSKLQSHVSQVDRERDKAVRELDASDEKISNMGIEIQRAHAEARKLECQLRTTAARCRKVEDLLENSERIAASLMKQKSHLEKEYGRTRNETDVLKKSLKDLKNKYKKTCNMLHVYKKKVWEANEEKVVLQSQIQEYVSRVRHIEDLLLQKEQEREFIFQQFQELTAKDNCRNSMDMTDKRESSPDVGSSSHSLTDTVYLANAGTQTHTLKEDNAGHGFNVNKDSLQVLDCDTKSSHYESIKTTRKDVKHIARESRDDQLSNQLNVMGRTVNSLESRMKTIGESLENCRKKCMSPGGKSFRQCSVESSLSTML